MMRYKELSNFLRYFLHILFFLFSQLLLTRILYANEFLNAHFIDTRIRAKPMFIHKKLNRLNCCFVFIQNASIEMNRLNMHFSCRNTKRLLLHQFDIYILSVSHLLKIYLFIFLYWPLFVPDTLSVCIWFFGGDKKKHRMN